MNWCNKKMAIVFIVLGIIGLGLLVTNMVLFDMYVVNNMDFYYPEYTGNSINGINYLSYFTFLSNIMVDVFLILLGTMILTDHKWVNKLTSPYIQGNITVYIFITGFLYLLVLSPGIKAYPWDCEMAMGNIVSFYNHVFMPVFMVLLWFFIKGDKRIDNKFILSVVVFPCIYFLFSVIRGTIINWYPYPFIHPLMFWEMVFGNLEYNVLTLWSAYLSFLLAVLSMFIGVAFALKFIRNKQLAKK